MLRKRNFTDSMSNIRFVLSGLIGASAVIAGASGAHGKWAEHLASIERLDQWQTAVQYQLVHAIVLLVLTVAFRLVKKPTAVFWAFNLVLTGVVLFSGSLYNICFTNISKFGAITPLGGLSMIAGWLAICFCGGLARDERN